MSKPKLHINSISCGQGAPSLYLIVAAGQDLFPAEVVIVADTGNENDMLWNTGRRTNAKTFFEEVTKPLAEEFGMKAYFVRRLDKFKKPYPDLPDKQGIFNGVTKLDMPLFGTRIKKKTGKPGRYSQWCTSKWKVAAIRQQLRRLGATSQISNLGITIDELHRIKDSKLIWETLEYPIAHLKRTNIVKQLEKMNIPYLVSSECDFCPHKDYARWERTDPEVLRNAVEFEERFRGKLFLTEYRVPLLEAIKIMEHKPNSSIDSCADGGVCFT